eukprot:jgi/Mesvir1/12318/Mv00511-RA.1
MKAPPLLQLAAVAVIAALFTCPPMASATPEFCPACPTTLEQFEAAAYNPNGCYFTASVNASTGSFQGADIKIATQANNILNIYANDIRLWRPSSNSFVKLDSANMNALWQACKPCSNHDCVDGVSLPKPVWCPSPWFSNTQFKPLNSHGAARVSTETFQMGSYAGWKILEQADTGPGGRTCIRVPITQASFKIGRTTYNMNPNDNLGAFIPKDKRCVYVKVVGSLDPNEGVCLVPAPPPVYPPPVK